MNCDRHVVFTANTDRHVGSTANTDRHVGSTGNTDCHVAFTVDTGSHVLSVEMCSQVKLTGRRASIALLLAGSSQIGSTVAGLCTVRHTPRD